MKLMDLIYSWTGWLWMINELPFEDDMVKVIDELGEFGVLVEKLGELGQEVSMFITEKMELVEIDLKKLLFKVCQVVSQVGVVSEDAGFGLVEESIMGGRGLMGGVGFLFIRHGYVSGAVGVDGVEERVGWGEGLGVGWYRR